jgi:hypothetical protein
MIETLILSWDLNALVQILIILFKWDGAINIDFVLVLRTMKYVVFF